MPQTFRARARLRSYRDLIVWQVGMDLVAESYRLCGRLPRNEIFGLSAQIRRAAVGIPSNIAEGYGRIHRGDYVRFLSIANGSLKELETEVLIAERLGYVTGDQVAGALGLAERVGRLLAALIRRLSTPQTPHPTPANPPPSPPSPASL
jgi:four helix bundle protein